MAPELFDGESRPSRESDIYALGMVIYEVCTLYAWRIGPDDSLPQVLAHTRPFSPIIHYAVPALVISGKRPLRPTNRDILGLSDNVWLLMEKCWDLDPSVRPHISDILALFETTSRRWISPTSEAIIELELGRPTSRSTPDTESTDMTPDGVFVTTGGSTVTPCKVGQSSPTLGG